MTAPAGGEGDKPGVSSDDFHVLKQIAMDLINENAELKNALEIKERELSLLYSLHRRITFSMNWDEIQEIVVELIMDFFPVVRFCMVALIGEDGELFITMKASGEETVSDVLQLGPGIDETSLWDDIVATEEWNRYFSGIEHLKNLQSSFIPLSFKDRQLGFLMICKNRNVEYDRDEWRFLSTIANYVGIALDNSRLDKMARTDALTGLFNRWYFTHRLEREIPRVSARQSTLSLFMIDIDHFKIVNDTYGHPAGDQVLVQLTDRLRKFSSENEQVFRIGGEEMILMAHDLSKVDSINRAEKLREAISEKPFVFFSSGEEIQNTITVSIGVAVFPDDTTDMNDLVSKSDQAMYRAKTGGRNRVASV